MKPKDVKFNAQGRRIGEAHPRAVLSDHEVDLLMAMLDEREKLIAILTAGKSTNHTIGLLLAANGLSFACIAEKFEVTKGHVAHIANGRRRSQAPYT